MRKTSAKQVARMGLLLALALTFSYLESLVPLGIPGIKLGLSNIVTMYCLFFLGPAPALILAVLKAGFVLLTRGAMAGILSAAGGLLSVAAMLLLKRTRVSVVFLSVTGAVAHNIAQLCVVFLFFATPIALYYLPALIVSGIIMGVTTAFILKLVMPTLQKFNFQD